jgi:hypothetical protein
MSYPMNYPNVYDAPPTAAPGKSGLLERFSPATQAGISALLLIPTLVLYFANWSLPAPDNESLFQVYFTGFVAIVDVYFVVVVALTARGRAPRIRALIVAGIITVIDVAMTFAWNLPYDNFVYVSAVCYTVIITVCVVAWGLARRQGWLWLIGLLPAVIVIGLAQIWWVPNHEVAHWYDSWVVNVGVFTLGCLLCWGVERLTRGSDRTAAERTR